MNSNTNVNDLDSNFYKRVADMSIPPAALGPLGAAGRFLYLAGTEGLRLGDLAKSFNVLRLSDNDVAGSIATLVEKGFSTNQTVGKQRYFITKAADEKVKIEAMSGGKVPDIALERHNLLAHARYGDTNEEASVPAAIRFLWKNGNCSYKNPPVLHASHSATEFTIAPVALDRLIELGIVEWTAGDARVALTKHASESYRKFPSTEDSDSSLPAPVNGALPAHALELLRAAVHGDKVGPNVLGHASILSKMVRSPQRKFLPVELMTASTENKFADITADLMRVGLIAIIDNNGYSLSEAAAELMLVPQVNDVTTTADRQPPLVSIMIEGVSMSISECIQLERKLTYVFAYTDDSGPIDGGISINYRGITFDREKAKQLTKELEVNKGA